MNFSSVSVRVVNTGHSPETAVDWYQAIAHDRNDNVVAVLEDTDPTVLCRRVYEAWGILMRISET